MSQSPIERLGGIVLCGGESRRMGRDKASLPFGLWTLLECVVNRVSEVARPVVVVAATGQTLPPLADHIQIVRDPVPGRGPLQGISAGLHALNGKADFAFVTSCDSPFLAPGWVQRLFELLGDYACAVPFVDGHLQPLSAIYRLDVLPQIDRMLATAVARPLSLFDLAPTRRVDEAELRDIDPSFETVRNINTQEDYQRALVDAGWPVI